MSNKAIWYKSLDPAEKEKLLSHRAEWDPGETELDPEEKEKLLSGRAEWYKILDPAGKDKIISQVQANKEVHKNSVQHDLDHKITAF